MLMTNLWVEHGAVNSAQGYVTDIIWEDEFDVGTVSPIAVLVKLDGY